MLMLKNVNNDSPIVNIMGTRLTVILVAKPVRDPVRADSRGGRKRLGSSVSSLSTPDP